MKIIFQKEPILEEQSIIHEIIVSDVDGKVALYYPKNHAKDSEKVSKIFDVLIETKKKIEGILNAT
jgi:hypothetical protein